MVWLGGVALLFAAYILAGVYLAPGLIRSQATQWVQTNLNKSIAIGEIKVHPLSFKIEISGIAIPASGPPMVGLAHLRLGFSPLSLFAKAYRLTELSFDHPFVQATIRPDGSLNLKELVPPSQGGESPAVRIDIVNVEQGRIDFSDQSSASHPRETLTPITFTLKDFHTKTNEGGGFTLEGKSERNESFAWRGTLSMAPIASQGRFTIAGLQSGTIAKFAGERLPVALTSGKIAIEGSYGFSYAQGAARLVMTVPRLALNDFAFEGRDRMLHGSVLIDDLTTGMNFDFVSDRPRPLAAALSNVLLRGVTLTGTGPVAGQTIRLANAGVTTAKLDMANHRIALGALSLGGLDLPVARLNNGTLSISQWLPPQNAPAGGAAPASVDSWAMALDNFSLSDASLHVEDRTVRPAARLDLTAISVTTQGVDSADQTKPVSLKVSAAINGKGRVEADGLVTPASRAADLKLSVSGLPLKSASAYLNHPVLDLRSGELSVSGMLSTSGGEHGVLRFKGDAGIDNLGLYERVNKSLLLSWRALKLTGIDYRSSPGQIDIARARLSRPVGGVAILPDRSFNFTSVISPKVAMPATPSPAPALAYRLKELDIDGGSMGFSDQSIDPGFQARIEALTGNIKNIASAPDAIATLDLKGQVIDRFSPVTISGTANLLGYDKNTDISMAFRNIELPIFNPYSGRYAGYAIAKGKLTTEMHYKVVNRALQADHHIIIDQLEWGQASANKPSVPWPVGLVTSLLKDRHGVIDLNLPVKGSLDDPTFRLGPVIWQIIGNLIEKVVTAPFALIGSLFEGADKAQYIAFAPGSSALPAGAADGLAALAKGLGDRPALQLDIPAAPALKEDAVAIADQRIDAQLMATEIKKGQPVNFAVLDRDEQHDRLTDLYRAKLGKRPAFPESLPALETKAPMSQPPPDADAQRQMQEILWMRGELRSAFMPSNPELAGLGSARATAVRDALLAKGEIDPARVFLAGGQAGSVTDGQVRLELKLR